MIWFILFLIIIMISLILAFRSMADFRDSPLYLSVPYSLFLVQDPTSLTASKLENLLVKVSQENLYISLEKLFKGDKQAVVFYGPTSILKPLEITLGLVELEEYTNKGSFQQDLVEGRVKAWEMVVKKTHLNNLNQLWQQLPRLGPHEQFWWQMVLKGKGTIWPFFKKTDQRVVDIKGVVWAADQKRASSLFEDLSAIFSQSGLLTRPSQGPLVSLVKFYQNRALLSSGNSAELSQEEMAKILNLY